MKFPIKLEKRLENRKQENAFRSLGGFENLTDFYSNDYLGLASSQKVYSNAQVILEEHMLKENGATGSRLLSGNHSLYPLTEDYIAGFHNAEAALIFNSGYDANVGFFSGVPQREDYIIYDELVHASIRDGIRMGNAKAIKYGHNDIDDLKEQVKRVKDKGGDSEIYIVTESVFSMDGEISNLEEIVALADNFQCHLVIDEAHAAGVFGEKGEGLLQKAGVEDKIFARINTFGKAFGCHGAVILGSNSLRDYLINFSRSFIYTTALPPHSVATILAAYQYLGNRTVGTLEIETLRRRITFFKSEVIKNQLDRIFLPSDSAIQCCIIPGNNAVRRISSQLEAEGYGVKAILSPTVPAGKERLRFCVHSYNSEDEIRRVLEILAAINKS